MGYVVCGAEANNAEAQRVNLGTMWNQEKSVVPQVFLISNQRLFFDLFIYLLFFFWGGGTRDSVNSE
jgi:hypothetical protein